MLATLPVLILRHRYCYGLAVHVLVLVLLLTLHLQLTHAALLPGAKITKYLQQHRNIDLATIEPILAVAEKAYKSWNNPCPTLFYDPYVAYSVLDAFSDVLGIQVALAGGYKLAERHRIVFKRMNEDIPVTVDIPSYSEYTEAVNIDANFLFEKPSSGDIIQAILQAAGPSLSEAEIGDIVLINDKGAQLICTPEAVLHVCSSLKMVGSMPVAVKPIPCAQLLVRTPIEKELSSIEASTRLDAIASAGLGISRSKMVKLVDQGSVSIDWKPVSNAAMQLQTGAVVNVRGVGRLLLVEVGKTAKGKVKVVMRRIV